MPPLWCHDSNVEKRKPTYDLAAVKLAIGSKDRLAMTVSAFRDANSLGFDRRAIVETILGTESRMFFKSMTTFADHRIWQESITCPHKPCFPT